MHGRRSKRIALATAGLALALAVAPARAYTMWLPTFVDDFGGIAVNSAYWKTIYSDGDPYISNNELQAYIPEASTVSTVSNNSQLHITAAKQQHLYGTTLMDYTSGALTTDSRFQQQYGYFEMRARMPAGPGLFPAFWLVSSDSSFAEIDIVEALGNDPHTVYFTLHGQPDGSQIEQGHYTDPCFSITDFHTYTVVWEPGLISWSLDGIERYQTTLSPNVPMHMLVNLAVGGDWAGPPDPSTVFPATYDVDYVRVYEALPEPSMLGLGGLAALGLRYRARKGPSPDEPAR